MRLPPRVSTTHRRVARDRAVSPDISGGAEAQTTTLVELNDYDGYVILRS